MANILQSARPPGRKRPTELLTVVDVTAVVAGGGAEAVGVIPQDAVFVPPAPRRRVPLQSVIGVPARRIETISETMVLVYQLETKVGGGRLASTRHRR